MCEDRLISPKIDRMAYVRARTMEVLSDLNVGINMWLAGGTRNAAGKVFGAVKALVSALVTKNLDKLSTNEWYLKRGYAAPTHALKGISIDLAKLGYADIEDLVDKAFLLHGYQYNGFDPDFSVYKTKDEVLHDIIIVTETILRNVKDWFKNEWGPDLDRLYAMVESEFKKLSSSTH
jgi:hypothetical protein